MVSSLNSRRRILAIALTLTVAATVWVSSKQNAPADDVVMPTRQAKAVSTLPTAKVSPADNPLSPADPLFSLGQTRTASRDIKDMFSGRSWFVPPPVPAAPLQPPPPPVAAVPPPPVAPPLPFRYLGKLEDGSDPPRIFLLKGNTVYIAHEGDVLDGTYRVTRIDAGQISFLCLPLQLEQSLTIGGPS